MEHIELEFINDKDVFQAYMPFLKNGGLFIKTTEAHDLGAEITLNVALPDSLEASFIKGQVCWLTPQGAQNGTPAGIGIAFIEDKENFKSQVEKHIGRFLNSSDPTFTM